MSLLTGRHADSKQGQQGGACTTGGPHGLGIRPGAAARGEWGARRQQAGDAKALAGLPPLMRQLTARQRQGVQAACAARWGGRNTAGLVGCQGGTHTGTPTHTRKLAQGNSARRLLPSVMSSATKGDGGPTSREVVGRLPAHKQCTAVPGDSAPGGGGTGNRNDTRPCAGTGSTHAEACGCQKHRVGWRDNITGEAGGGVGLRAAAKSHNGGENKGERETGGHGRPRHTNKQSLAPWVRLQESPSVDMPCSSPMQVGWGAPRGPPRPRGVEHPPAPLSRPLAASCQGGGCPHALVHRRRAARCGKQAALAGWAPLAAAKLSCHPIAGP